MARQVARKVAQVSVFNIFSGFFCKTTTSRDQIQGFSLPSVERKQPSPLRQRQRERRKAISVWAKHQLRDRVHLCYLMNRFRDTFTASGQLQTQAVNVVLDRNFRKFWSNGSRPPTHPKSLPVKTGLGSLRHSLASCHATRLTVTLFRSDTPKPHLFVTALQSGLGPVQTNPDNKLCCFKNVWCEQGLTGHRICLGGQVNVTLPPVPLSVFGTYERRISFISRRDS